MFLDRLAFLDMLLQEHEQRCEHLSSVQIAEMLQIEEVMLLTVDLPVEMSNHRKMIIVMNHLLSKACSLDVPTETNNMAKEIFLRLVELSEEKLEEARFSNIT